MRRSLCFFLAGAMLVAPPLRADPVEQGPPNVPAFHPAFPEQTRAPEADSGVTLQVERLAEGLEHPWGMAILPDGGYLITERPGRLRLFAAGALREAPVAGVPAVLNDGQGGLLDVAVDGDFAANRLVYLAYSKPLGEGMSATAVARGRLTDDGAALTDVTDIFVQEPPSPVAMQYGSRVVFDDAGHVFVTLGEHSRPDQRVKAQDLATTYGKVVRLGLDGSAPPDNPFAGMEGALAPIWSLGHRNPQGAAIRPGTGELWAVEHGPRGGDELNLVEAGTNYGWPTVSYGENYDGTPVGDGITSAEGMAEPRYYWDPVIAPGGMTFYQGAMFPEWDGDVLIGAMKPGALVRLLLDGDKVAGEERLLKDQGRIRDVAVAPDGAVLALTDAENGALLRLTPAAAD
ncbi:MAG: PQQ-dependent sugar dehydrogenase [Amaricoccus sp.]